MALISKYGTVYGEIPQVMGRVYFVAPSASYTVDGRGCSASDNNDGLHPEKAVLTIQRAINLAGVGANSGSAVSNIGDAVVLLPGTHTVTATINVNVAGLTIWGVASSENTFPRSTRTRVIVTSTGTSDELFNITVSNVEMGYFTARPTTGFGAFTFQTTSALDNLYFHDLVVDLMFPLASVNTKGFDFSNRAGGAGFARIAATTGLATAYLERITVMADGAQGEAFHLATCNVHVKDSYVENHSGTWASPFVVATNCQNSLLENIVWTGAGTTTMCLYGNAVGGALATNAVTLVNCRFNTSSDIVGFTTGSLVTITSYEPTSGGTLSTIL